MYAVAAAIGLGAFLIVYGPSHLIGAGPYWQMPEQDERMALMGYRYFVQDSWHWPLFLNHAINVPYAKSVAFLDCIPIWALVNKTIATLIPPWKSFSMEAYLGLWHGLAYALQACLGVSCLRGLGHRSWRDGIVGALFFIAVPTWIFRYPHPALSAHWILLWAFSLYIRTPVGERSPRRLGIAKVAQLATAALVTPYLAVMSLPVFLASLFRARARWTIAVWFPLGVAVVGLANWFAGYFAKETMRPQWGFEWESANLLGWIIPQRSGIVGDAQWIARAEGTPWQYEGYAYLGLGVLLLLAIFLPRVTSLKRVIRRHWALFVVAVAAALFALANHVFFGSHELFTYPIPRILRWIPNQFRSPGRFVWIPTYALIVFLLHWSLTRFVAWRKFTIVALAVLVQLVDARGDWGLQRDKTRAVHGALLDSAAWRPLVHAHRAVFILPTYSCVYGDDAATFDHASIEIQVFSSEKALPINGTYSAREMRKCEAEEDEWPSLAIEPNVLYVLLPQAFAVAERFQAGGAHCGVFDFGRACSTNEQAIESAITANALRRPHEPISLGYGEKLSLATTPLASAGWTGSEEGGRWTNSNVASLLLQLQGEPPAELALHVQLQARLCGKREIEDVDIMLDDFVLTTLHFEKASNDALSARRISIPEGQRLRLARAFTLQLRPHDVRAPQKIGCGADARRIGVLVSQLWFE